MNCSRGIFLLFALILSPPSSAQVVINEVEQNPPCDNRDPGCLEWVELYNSGDETVDIGGWIVSSSHGGLTSNQMIPLGTTLPPKGFCFVEVLRWLDDFGEVLILRDSAGREVDRTPPMSDQCNGDCAWSRSPDGHDTDSYLDWEPMRSSKNRTASLNRCSKRLTGSRFEYSGLASGNISSVEVTPKGRTIEPYHSYYADVEMGTARYHERIGAKEGRLTAEDTMYFEASTAELYNETVESPILTIQLKGTLTVSSWDAKRDLNYSGIGISDREFTSQLAGSSVTRFLYNDNLTKERRFSSADSYSLEALTSGIADIRVNQTISSIRARTQYGENIQADLDSEGYLLSEQRTHGKFNITINPRETQRILLESQRGIEINCGDSELSYSYCVEHGWLDDQCWIPACG